MCELRLPRGKLRDSPAAICAPARIFGFQRLRLAVLEANTDVSLACAEGQDADLSAQRAERSFKRSRCRPLRILCKLAVVKIAW